MEDLEVAFDQWTAMLGLADAYGFRPSRKGWRFQAGYESYREPHIPHFWWEFVCARGDASWFVPEESEQLCDALRTLLRDSGKQLQGLIRSLPAGRRKTKLDAISHNVPFDEIVYLLRLGKTGAL